jgi:hypothetical protein
MTWKLRVLVDNRDEDAARERFGPPHSEQDQRVCLDDTMGE